MCVYIYTHAHAHAHTHTNISIANPLSLSLSLSLSLTHTHTHTRQQWQLDSEGKKRIFSGRNKEQREVKHDTHDKSFQEMHENGVQAVDVQESTFDSFLHEKENAFVDFYAPWCIWCQRLHPTWEAFAEKVDEEGMPISVGKVDCIKESKLCAAQKVNAFPTLRWFTNGNAVQPDYKSDRTVNALNAFAARKLEATEKFKDWEKKAKERGEAGNKKPAPPPTYTGAPTTPSARRPAT